MRARFPLVALVASSIASCSDCAPGEFVEVSFALPRESSTLGFLETPWPSDLMKKDGGLDLLSFPNPYASGTLEDVIALIQTNPSYSATGTLFFHVEGGIDEASLPSTAARSLADDANMFLVETNGLRRVPIVWQQFKDGDAFLPAGTMAVQPLLGAVPKGPFALVVTTKALAANGLSLGPSSEMLALTRCEPLPVDARPAKCAPYQKLVADLGLTPEGVALVQMITPLDATGGLLDAVDVVRALPAPEYVFTLHRTEDDTDNYSTYEGTVALPQFQAGTAPYYALDGETGGFVLGDDGLPEVQRFEDVRFLLTVPKTAQPASGYCVAINGHGTGGDFESSLGDGPNSEAWQLAEAGCAMLATSEPLHFSRSGYREGQEEVLTFNFFNPVAGRDNWRQSALEKVALVTFAQNVVVPADITGDVEVRLNPAAVSYFGHSQGGIVGGLFVPVEDRITGAFLSGAGAGFGISLVEKVDPVKISGAIKEVLFMPEEEEIGRFHPVISLLQTWVDPADPINYGALWREREGVVPHLVVTSGLVDTFTPKSCHAGLAGAFRIPVATPVAEELEIHEVVGIDPAPAEVQGNLTTVDGAPLTSAILQYPEDGHFAVYRNADAQAAMREFFTTLQEGVPSVRVE